MRMRKIEQGPVNRVSLVHVVVIPHWALLIHRVPVDTRFFHVPALCLSLVKVNTEQRALALTPVLLGAYQKKTSGTT